MIMPWLLFLAFICFMLILDLGVFNKHDHVIKSKEALKWTAFWIALALVFNLVIYFAYQAHWFGLGSDLSGKEAAIKFFTGYIIEKSLSLDNIFVIAMIFSYFKIPGKYQHRVLFWGILGALVMRAGMIFAGTALIQKFDWMIYVFGGFLILTAIKMLFTQDEHLDPEQSFLVRLARKMFTITPDYDGHNFFTTYKGKKAATPLFLVLIIIESTDLLFAIDSIPAIFAVTTDPFIVFTSNVFAILGLRSLYFALASMMDQFRYLKLSLVTVLAYVGIKMLLTHSYPIPAFISLGVIALALGAGILASIWIGPKPLRK